MCTKHLSDLACMSSDTEVWNLISMDRIFYNFLRDILGKIKEMTESKSERNKLMMVFLGPHLGPTNRQTF